MVQMKKEVAKELRNAQRRKKRLRVKGQTLTVEDVVEVIRIREDKRRTVESRDEGQSRSPAPSTPSTTAAASSTSSPASARGLASRVGETP